MPKLCSTVHEVAWQFNNLALGHYPVRIGFKREQNYTEIVLKHVF